jgi:C-terminal processing protease CtpA/Prc
MRPLRLLAASVAAFLLLTVPLSAQQHAGCRPPDGPSGSPRALTDGGLRNLIAFTRLLGYIRHFHPSDQALHADWDRLAIEGVRHMETCEGPEQLAAALETFFRPVAPTVQVYPTGSQRTPPSEVAPATVANLRVVSWRHVGPGQVALPLSIGSDDAHPSIYRSERISAPPFAIQPLTGGAEPSQIFSADLGAGVSARVPLKLYADAAGTLPHGRAPAPGDTAQPSANDRSTRLAAVALAWNVFQHFYPYFDVVDADWPRVLQTALSSAATDKDERAFLDTLRRLVAALRDGHGAVYQRPLDGAVQPQAQLPLVWAMVEGKLVVTHVLPTAAAAGLAPGDVVVGIDGQATEAVLSHARELQSAATPQFMRHLLAGVLRRGPPDSVVRLEVQAVNGAQRQVELRRKLEDEFPDDPRPAKVAELEPGILYFDINRADEADFKAALPKLAEAKAVIFDLRVYPRMAAYLSHLSAAPLQSPIWQIPIVTRPDRLGVAEYDISGRWHLPPESPRLAGRIIFLIEGRAISFAESVMGTIEAYKLADIVGEPTAGTNGNVAAFHVPGGFTLYWTGMRVLKHDGSRHHGVGILPTHPVQRTIKGVSERRDEILEKGLELARLAR